MHIIFYALMLAQFSRDHSMGSVSDDPNVELQKSFVKEQPVFDSRTFLGKNELSGFPRVQYRIYVPNSYAASLNKLPLLLWLHGVGESGDENQSQLKHIDRAIWMWQRKHGEFPALVIAPQCAKDDPFWFHNFDSNISTNVDMLSVAWAIVQAVASEYPVDDHRLYLLGVSSGGTACWEMASRHPGRFAAIAPMASVGGDLSRVKNLGQTPIWCFHSTYDSVTPIFRARKTVEAVQANGGVVCLTEIASNSHDCWTAAFTRNHVLEWLVDQKLGKSSSGLPCRLVSQWRPTLPCIGVLVLILIVLLAESKRKRRASLRPQ